MNAFRLKREKSKKIIEKSSLLKFKGDFDI
jgi:hypothetical protein